MKSKFAKLSVVASLLAMSNVALAAGADCCATIACCLQMLGCC
jgi:hypothetical protein